MILEFELCLLRIEKHYSHYTAVNFFREKFHLRSLPQEFDAETIIINKGKRIQQ